jgi:hypothetical protein
MVRKLRLNESVRDDMEIRELVYYIKNNNVLEGFNVYDFYWLEGNFHFYAYKNILKSITISFKCDWGTKYKFSKGETILEILPYDIDSGSTEIKVSDKNINDIRNSFKMQGYDELSNNILALINICKEKYPNENIDFDRDFHD